MMYCAELVTYTITTDEADFIARRTAAIAEVKAAHPALMSVPFVGRRSDGTYLDVWIYETLDAANAANADAENMPAFTDFFSVLSRVGIEVTEFPKDAVSPLT
ncbi:hypothetical protein HQ346_23940 [Rhodococcus sp. BP-252]|uniref:hypothetical protein n=1 Tax=unclassified Rhodococcus (in: high G+C Gram-positive bacteria) TaxID=192944 RepID=UPI001C9A7DC0|nr:MULTISPECIES: hypothetical protein [unclassified Rhodococcus (in: high G+C Gram-positive bacteria)]MBY6414667.1 hypothetical protein [Rhodococcus sp. BP-320]MBY6419492.1 hypothetical protein [Rhodococcus sp. BP-321]MBY6424496.1 hypothetical protein [Rhodococcus sp. BP-324]MBY6429503.1 hypothetical protein [Rhodococcus sp. BP-323]MBY6434506.1 hypothetical protein [Rhodococcus sp. BP-322]